SAGSPGCGPRSCWKDSWRSGIRREVSWRDRQAGTVPRRFGEEAVLLVNLQLEMRGGAEDALQRAEFFGDETGHLLQTAGADRHREVEAAAHEPAGVHLIVFGNALR